MDLWFFCQVGFVIFILYWFAAIVSFFPVLVIYFTKNTKLSRKAVRALAFAIAPFVLLGYAVFAAIIGAFVVAGVILVILLFSMAAILYVINSFFKIGSLLRKWLWISNRILTVIHRQLELFWYLFRPVPRRP
jgi:hypothetical protein